MSKTAFICLVMLSLSSIVTSGQCQTDQSNAAMTASTDDREKAMKLYEMSDEVLGITDKICRNSPLSEKEKEVFKIMKAWDFFEKASAIGRAWNRFSGGLSPDRIEYKTEIERFEANGYHIGILIGVLDGSKLYREQDPLKYVDSQSKCNKYYPPEPNLYLGTKSQSSCFYLMGKYENSFLKGYNEGNIIGRGISLSIKSDKERIPYQMDSIKITITATTKYDGKPLEGANVEINTNNFKIMDITNNIGETDKNGKFSAYFKYVPLDQGSKKSDSIFFTANVAKYGIEAKSSCNVQVGDLPEIEAKIFSPTVTSAPGLTSSMTAATSETKDVSTITSTTSSPPTGTTTTSSTSTTLSAIGHTIKNPAPIGTTVDLAGEWDLTVVDVDLDATESVLGNLPQGPILHFPYPDPGRELVVVWVKAKYKGLEFAAPYLPDIGSFHGDSLRAVGPSGIVYKGNSPDGCCPYGTYRRDITPYFLSVGETASGSVCFDVKSSDADRLVLYYDIYGGEKRVYMAIYPVDG